MADAFDKGDTSKAKAIDALAEPDWFNFAAKKRNLDQIQIHSNASLASIKEALGDRHPSVDFSQILPQNKRVIFFGERHDDLSQKDVVASHLKQLKHKEGLTHIALEILNDSDLPFVQEYFAGSGSRQVVLDRIKSRWSVSPGAPEKYMELLDAAKAAKLIPVALDESGSWSDNHTDSVFQNRNERWAHRLSDLLKDNQKAKVLVYSGRDHVGYGATKDHANEILQSEFGYSSNVVLMSSAIDDSSKLSGRVSIAAVKAGLKRKAFALSIDVSEDERPGDFVLHQPQ